MTSAAKQLLAQALALPVDERRHLVEALLDATPSETDEEIETAWLEDARRRAACWEHGEVEARDGAEALAEFEVNFRTSTLDGERCANRDGSHG